MHDLVADECSAIRYIENIIVQLASYYGYEEIRTPILEDTNLFARTLGDCTDIINKEMYSFNDRNKQLVSLRPEGTAGVVRAGLQHGLFYNQNKAFWYMGPMFRRERPQKGRLRQFHQFGIELVGCDSIFAEVELISFCYHLWQKLNLHDIVLEINTLGSNEDRSSYKQALVHYFNSVKDQLTQEEQITLTQNPLRLLDSKAVHLQHLIKQAPKMMDYYAQETLDKFQQFTTALNSLNINYTHNPYLVRGLDYYNDIVFEWTTNKLGSQGTVCAGGRYNSLVAQLNNDMKNLDSYHAAGFAIGLERLVSLVDLSTVNEVKKIIVICEDNLLKNKYAFTLRQQVSNVKIICDYRSSSIKSQLKKAIKANIDFAIVVKDANTCEFKYLKSNKLSILASLQDCVDGILTGEYINV